ncbi:MAG TPA: IS1595 family transposase [Bacteroidales bacterium]|nr:IS1595 family transposase [Bacteroidales bacterium]
MPLDKPRFIVYYLSNGRDEMTEYEVAKMTEDEARVYLEGIRWSEGPVCPHCGATSQDAKIYLLEGHSHRPGLRKCGKCRRQFTVTVGTIMEDSHIPLSKWVLAFHKICSSKKGISALQLQRELGLGSYKTAWFMAHRIRLAFEQSPLAKKLAGIVEVDETYVGGKPIKDSGKRGRGTKKTPVVVAVERKGKAFSKPVDNISSAEMEKKVLHAVDHGSILMTDEYTTYIPIGRTFKEHHRVLHSSGEYSRGFVYTNTAESYFSLLKRGVIGIFHFISRKHMERYCAEFNFRWDHRQALGYNDSQRRDAAVLGISGKRLQFADLLRGEI